MNSNSPHQLTLLLRDRRRGNQATLDKQMPLKTVMREWNLAKAWLLHHLKRGGK